MPLINLKRGNQNQFDTIDEKLIDKYLSKNAPGCFPEVKPSESKKKLTEVSNDLFDLARQFKDCADVATMS